MGPSNDPLGSVQAALAAALSGREMEIRVSWLPAGILALEGQVETLAEKQRLGEVACRAAGPVPVENALNIVPVPDPELAPMARTALHATGIASLGVRVENGVAHLGGRAEGLAVLRQAREALARVPGIREIRHDRVVLHLDREREEIEILASLEDWDILAGVRQKLEEGMPRQAREIVATCRNAIVTLTGVVSGEDARARAESLARSAFGVEGVRNRILNVDAPPLRASELEERVARAIGLDPDRPPDIRIYMVDDVAYVLGKVGFQDAAWQALALIRREPGVSQVFDRLIIRHRDFMYRSP